MAVSVKLYCLLICLLSSESDFSEICKLPKNYGKIGRPVVTSWISKIYATHITANSIPKVFF